MKKAIYLLVLAYLLLAAFCATAQTSAVAATINISKLIVYEKDNRLFVEWATDGATETNYWEVQSSTDGKKFSTIALVLGADPSKPADQYGYKGKLAELKNAEYYRVVHISASGGRQQSNIIKLMKLDAMSFINPDIKTKAPAVL